MNRLWPEYINPELSLDRKQRKEIHRDAWKSWWADKRNIAFYLLLPACYMLTVWFASDAGGWLASLIGTSGRTLKLSRAAAPLVLFVVCFVLGGAILQRYRFAPCVYRALRAHGHGVCIKCGYWLRGLPDTTDRCPECGAERKVVGQDDVKQAPPAEGDNPGG